MACEIMHSNRLHFSPAPSFSSSTSLITLKRFQLVQCAFYLTNINLKKRFFFSIRKMLSIRQLITEFSVKNQKLNWKRIHHFSEWFVTEYSCWSCFSHQIESHELKSKSSHNSIIEIALVENQMLTAKSGKTFSSVKLVVNSVESIVYVVWWRQAKAGESIDWCNRDKPGFINWRCLSYYRQHHLSHHSHLFSWSFSFWHCLMQTALK